jgi:hypothetical protein
MPYSIRRRRKGCFQVFNRKSKRIFSKCTTQEQAKKQLRLLRAIQYNKDFVPRRRTRKYKLKTT